MKNQIRSHSSKALATLLLSLSVSAQAGALTANPDRLNTSVGQANTVEVLWNDRGGHFWVSGVNSYSANGGRAYVVAGKKIHYTPKPGFRGTDVFWYQITDARGNTNSSKVTVNVGGGHKQAHRKPVHHKPVKHQPIKHRPVKHKQTHHKPAYSIQWSKPGISLSYSKPGGLEATFSQPQPRKPAHSGGHKHRGGSNPVGRYDAYTTYSGSGQIALHVLANDQGAGLRVQKTNPWTVNGGRARVVNDHSGSYIAYMPKPGFRGVDELWYVLRDQNGRTNSTKVNISVH